VACNTQIQTGSLDLDRQSGVARRSHSPTMAAPRALSWRPIPSRS